MTHNFNSLIKDREESIQSAYTFFFSHDETNYHMFKK